MAAFSFFAFAKVDTTLNVNSAFYTDNIIDKKPVNGQYLMMNISVKNNGKDALTVSNDQFTPLIDGKPVEKYSVFTGDGTDLQRQIQIPGGQSKDILVIFDIGDQKPNSVEYHGPIAWAPTYKNSTPINTITPGVPFDGMNLKLSTNLDMGGEVAGLSFNVKSNVTTTEKFEKTNDSNLIKETSTDTSTSTSTISGQSDTQNVTEVNTGIIDLRTGLYENGTFSAMLPKNLTKNGDTMTAENSTYTIVGSETIDILNHKIDCWKVEGTSEAQGAKLKAVIYYDKTTGIPIKMVIDKQDAEISGLTVQIQGGGELISTNVPLIGIA